MIKRTLLVVSLLLLPLAASAQPLNELGVFVSTSQFEDSELRGDLGSLDVEFDEDMGYGILYNRFWWDTFSTEIAYQKLGADLTASFQDIRENIGDLDLDILSATGQFHFARGSLLSPYFGGGVAYISGEAGSIDRDELQAADLENELDFLVNAGLNIALTQGIAVYVDGKYILYEARGQDDAEQDALEINPLILSGGIRLRF